MDSIGTDKYIHSKFFKQALKEQKEKIIDLVENMSMTEISHELIEQIKKI